MTASLADAVWEYDLTQMPFRLHIRHMSDEVASEMREGRNIQSLRYTIDRSRMYTRFYPIGKNNLHIAGEYVARNEDLYGTVCKIETDQSLDTEGKLRAWANERLSRHCEPAVTVTVQGIDYSQATGEPLDNVQLNKKCRVPLPKYSTTIVETVKKLSWPDKIKEPKRFTVTLANILEDVASIVNRETAKSAGGGRGGAKQQEEDHAWFVDTTEKVGMVAEAVAGSINGHPNWSRVAELMVDGNGVDARVTRAEGDIVTHTARLDLTDSAITAEVTARQAETSSLSGRLTVEAGKVAMVVGTRTTQSGEENYIKAGEITLAINNAGESEAHIDANKVYIGSDKSTTVIAGKLNASDVTANYIQAKISDISILAANALSVAGGINGSGTLTVANLATFNGSVRLGSGNSFSKCIVSATVNDTTNTLTLVDSNGDTVNFSKAASVALSGSWSGTTYTASAVAGSTVVDTISTSVALDLTGSANVIGASVKSGATVLDSKGAQLTENVADKKVYCKLTSGSQSTIAQVSTQDTYNAGSSAGYASAHLSGSWSGHEYTVTKVQSGSTNSITLTVTAGASLSYSTSTHKYTATGSAKVNGTERNTATAISGTEAYNQGWNDCIDAMGLYQSGGSYYFYKYYTSTYLYPGPMLPTGQGQYYHIASGYGTISKK